MNRFAIFTFILAMLVVPCSCGDDDSENESENRREVENDNSKGGDETDHQGDKDKKDQQKSDVYECVIKPLSRTLYFAGEDELYVYMQSNRSLGSLTLFVEDAEGKKIEVQRESFHDFVRVHTPDVVGDLKLIVADSDGSNPQEIAFRNLDEDNCKMMRVDIDSPFIDLLNGKSFPREDAQSGSAWLMLDEEKGLVGANGFSVRFDNAETSFSQAGETRQFSVSNGYEGLIILVKANSVDHKKHDFSFAYCLK